MVRLHFWKEGSNSSLTLLPDSLLPGVVVPVKVPYVGQIDMFENYMYLIGILDII